MRDREMLASPPTLPLTHADTSRELDATRARRLAWAELMKRVFATTCSNARAAADRCASSQRSTRGGDYLAQVAVPNFFFHITMAYAILRHNGVQLGKMDYIGSIPTHDANE